jgi:membrane-bound lytic murein transglycosylase D
MEKAEASFEKGAADYHSGHLGVAKDEFNAALDVILQAPVNLQSDRRLSKTFESLVDRIHSYELQALREGDGFTEPAYQPAPLDELQSLTFPDNPALRERARADAANTVSDIPLVVNSQVANFIEYFAHGRGRSSLEAGLRRSGRFHDMILRVLQEERVPLDLLYVAQAESAFQYLARSNKGATGIWQFMSATGRPYGLENNWWLDERLNPEKATRAAAKHLKDLHGMFGDWYLAFAAYNCGPMCIQSAVERTGYADFWELSSRRALPAETRNYVPIILALTIIAKNPEKYGIDNLLPDPPQVYDTVTVTEPVDLRLASEIVGSSVETLRELNPSLLRLTSPKVPEYELRLPLATKDIFLKRIAMIPPAKRVWWRWHTVDYGETLSSIAKKLGSTPQAIAEANNLDPDQPLRESAELVIPVTPPVGGDIRYQVRGKETLASVARRYKVSPEEIMARNNLASQVLQRGTVLLIPTPSSRPKVSAPPVPAAVHTARVRPARASAPRKHAATLRASGVHRVRKGESLSQNAASRNTTVAALKERNGQLRDTPPIGAQIIIPAAK